MTPSHRRTRIKIAGRWVMPGAIVQMVSPPDLPAPLEVVGPRSDIYAHHVVLLNPATGRERLVPRSHVVKGLVRIVE